MDIFILAVHMFQPRVDAGCLSECLFFFLNIYFTQEDCQNSCFSEEYFTSFVIIHKGVILFIYLEESARGGEQKGCVSR